MRDALSSRICWFCLHCSTKLSQSCWMEDRCCWTCPALALGRWSRSFSPSSQTWVRRTSPSSTRSMAPWQIDLNTFSFVFLTPTMFLNQIFFLFFHFTSCRAHSKFYSHLYQRLRFSESSCSVQYQFYLQFLEFAFHNLSVSRSVRALFHYLPLFWKPTMELLN